MQVTEKKSVPRLRFKDDNGGDFPDWEKKKLGEVALFLDDKRIPLSQDERSSRKGPYPYYGASGIIDYVDDYLFDGEFVLLGEDGANIVTRSTKLAFVIRGKNWVNNHAHVLQAYGSVSFLAESLERINYGPYNSGTAQPKLNAKTCKRILLNFPTLPEQRKIANFLSSVDKQIEQLTQKKSLLEQYKKGATQQIFSQQIRFKDDDGGDFPDWEEKKLGDVLVIGSGRDYKHLGKGTIPVYGSGGLMTYVNDQLYMGESVCIGRKGTIDSPLFLDGAFWTVDTLFYTHSFKNVLPRFLFAVFQRVNWRKYNEASGVPSLSKGTIEKIPVSIPATGEQTKIANFLSALDRKIETVASQIAEMQTFKRGLLQQMFV